MAVPVQTPYQEYAANGVTTSFAVTFQCLSKDTLIVTINGVEQSPTLWSFTGGNVVFVAAPANLAIVGIKRSTALNREVTYQAYGNSFRPDVLNNDIDRLWHVLQENKYIYDAKVDKTTNIQTLGNLQGGGQINGGLTLSLKDQTVTANYAFGSSIKIPIIELNQDGTVKSLHDVDLIGGAGGAFQIGWNDVLNTPTTLNGYGITNAYTKTEANDLFIENTEKGVPNGIAPLDANIKVDPIYISNLNEALFNQTNFPNLVPILFAPIPYPKEAVPAGFLLMNGQAITQAQYPILYSLYGANLPDLRGSFIRGLDNGKGYDTGRGILTYQADELKSHTHSVARAQNSGVGSLTDRVATAYGDSGMANNAAQATGGTETRPKNIAFNYIVRAG